ncbi:MAG: RICIN domain-containing protein [Pseudonocardia sp.]
MFSLIGFSATAVAAVLAFSTSMSAAPAELMNVETRSCLDSAANSVNTSPCNRSGGQQWELGSGTTLRNVATVSCLDSDVSKRVYTSPCNGGSYQSWALGNGASGTTLRNLATGFCLDSSNNAVNTSQCNGNPSQQWRGIQGTL